MIPMQRVPGAEAFRAARADIRYQLVVLRRNLLEAWAFSLLFWLPLALLLWLRTPPYWPWQTHYIGAVPLRGDYGALVDVAILVWIAEFLFVKSYLMWARTRVKTGLGLALIAVNAAFTLTYYSLVYAIFWPFYPHVADVRWVIRLLLALAVTWAVVRLSRMIDPGVGEPADAFEPTRLIALLYEEVALNRQQIAALTEQIRLLAEQNALLIQAFTGAPPVAAPEG